MVANCLKDNDFDPDCARKVARLCTRNGVLPQGAPTSPALSNATLYPFDEFMAAICTASGLRYTRYADDVTVSGGDAATIRTVLARAEAELQSRYQLQVNHKKSRVIDRHAQQRVTGAVVNVSATPPRTLRRRVRAAFHQASKDPNVYATEALRLRGYVSYLQGFPSLRISKELEGYRLLLAKAH